jgi:hypothetical protein
MCIEKQSEKVACNLYKKKIPPPSQERRSKDYIKQNFQQV